MTFRSTSRQFLVLQYIVFKNLPLNLVVRVTAFAQEKSGSEMQCQSGDLYVAEDTKTDQIDASEDVLGNRVIETAAFAWLETRL